MLDSHKAVEERMTFLIIVCSWFKESQLYSFPSMHSPNAILISPNFFLMNGIDYSSSVIWIPKKTLLASQAS